MSLQELSERLYDSAPSAFVRDVEWLIPTIQSVHILAIAVVLASTLVVALRLVGALATDAPREAVLARYTPWLGGALLVLLATGLLLILSEPDRTLTNDLFWLKMGLVLVAFGFTRLLAKGSAAFAVIAFGLWIAIVACGRWIAYV